MKKILVKNIRNINQNKKNWNLRIKIKQLNFYHHPYLINLLKFKSLQKIIKILDLKVNYIINLAWENKNKLKITWLKKYLQIKYNKNK